MLQFYSIAKEVIKDFEFFLFLVSSMHIGGGSSSSFDEVANVCRTAIL